MKEHDISKGLLAKIKFEGGHIWVNGEEQFATYPVHGRRECVAIEILMSTTHETLPIPFDLDIVYEDDNFLVINKPYGYASIPSVNQDNTWLILSNITLSAIIIPTSVSIVTRPDKDTSGLMLFAKKAWFAHARMDKQLQQKSIKKHYYALG